MSKQTKLIISSLLLINIIGCSKKEPSNDPLSPSGTYKNLIIVIGDGMGLEHISSGELYSNKHFSFTDWCNAFSNTDSYGTSGDYAIHTTDSAASGTALATGELTINGYIGKDKYGNDLETIMDHAKQCQKSTGIVTTDYASGATPAAFSAHSLDRNNTDEIFNSQIVSGIDVICSQKSSTYSNNTAKIEEYYTYSEDLNSINIDSIDKLLYQGQVEENGGNIKLIDMTKAAIEILSKNENGYCLMVEQAYIDKQSHNNNFEEMCKAVNNLNDTIEYISKLEDTAIIVTSDHETGDLSVSSNNILSNKIDVNGRNISYNFGSTSHSKKEVGFYVNKEINFNALNYYCSSSLIKNSNTYDISKVLISYDQKYKKSSD